MLAHLAIVRFCAETAEAQKYLQALPLGNSDGRDVWTSELRNTTETFEVNL